MNKYAKTVWIYLIGIAVLVGGCQSRTGSATALATAQGAATPTAFTGIATRAIVAAASPTATNDGAGPSDRNQGTKVTSTPSATPEPTLTHTPVSPTAVAGSGYQEGFTDQGEPFRGDLAAPIVMEEFSSYQCGFCAKYFRESFGQVIAEYVETGQLLYVYRDFPLPSQAQSSLAAEAANCAGKAGDGSTYWMMHDLLFARQSEWSGRGDASNIFKEYARELELERAIFDQCLDSGETRALVEADVAEAFARGVRGTPTFFIGGQLLVGAQPYTVIASSIDAALAAAMTGEDKRETTLELAPASALDADLRQLPQPVQEAYRFALANPDVLEVIPCFCGCNGVGHQDNRMCYVQSETADGQVVFDRHAVT